MKYLVVRPAGDLCKVYIVVEGTELPTPFESWALRDGKQVVFATVRLHKIIQGHHIAGSYEQGALYAYTYEEMCAVISMHVGPSDRERYEAGLREQSDQNLIKAIPANEKRKWYRIAYILWKTFAFAVIVSIKALNTILFLVILPFFIAWIKNLRK